MARARDDAPISLVDDLKGIERELAEARAYLQEVQQERVDVKPEVTRDTILQVLRESADQLLAMNREVGPLLERLIPGKIRAVPYQQFGSTNVVLRAELELMLVNLLPLNLRAALEGQPLDTQNANWMSPISIVVDLFPPAEVPANAMRAIALYEDSGMTLDKLAAELGMIRRQAHRAKDLGKAMREAGLSDPYIRLTEPPDAAAHWRTHASYKDNSGGEAAA